MTRFVFVTLLSLCASTAAARPFAITGRVTTPYQVDNFPSVAVNANLTLRFDLPEFMGHPGSSYSNQWYSADVFVSGKLADSGTRLTVGDQPGSTGRVYLMDYKGRDIQSFTVFDVAIETSNTDGSNSALEGQVRLRIDETAAWRSGLFLADLPLEPVLTGNNDDFYIHTAGGEPYAFGTLDSFTTYREGDVDLDGVFNQLDLVAVLQGDKYLQPQPATWYEGDWTGDGVFNHLDIVAALPNYSVQSAAALSAVPEPTAMFLACVGASLLLIHRRKTNR